MPIISSGSAASSRAFGEFSASQQQKQYIEDYFSAYLYTGDQVRQLVQSPLEMVNTAAWSSFGLYEGGSQTAGIDLDSANNMCIVGIGNDGVSYGYVAKVTQTGSILWQRKLRQSSTSTFAAVAVDSSDNIFAFGRANDGAFYNLLAKYDTNGNLLWQRKIRQTSGNPYAVTVDPSGNVIIAGSSSDGSNYNLLAKYDTNGNIQWQKKIRQTSTAIGYGVSCDSSGNIIVVGSANDTSFYSGIVKLDPSGNILWQQKFRYGTQSSAAYSVAIDSLDNVYVVGTGIDTVTLGYVIKYNSSGTLQWQRKLSDRSTNTTPRFVVTDSSNNVYVCVEASSFALGVVSVIKYNSSGVLQWQKYLKGNVSGSTLARGLAIDSSGNLFVAGTTSVPQVSNNIGYVSIIKTDGSTTSGYAINNLIDSFVTDSAGTGTDATGTQTVSAGTATDSAGTATDSAAGMVGIFQSQAAISNANGLVWTKLRTGGYGQFLWDTKRGSNYYLMSNTTDVNTVAGSSGSGVTFGSGCFMLGPDAQWNATSQYGMSWSFKTGTKFFDIVTYTGNGAASQTVNHNLGSAPGMIIVKGTSNLTDWPVYHRSLNNGTTPEQWYLRLNATSAQNNSVSNWGNISPTATQFTVGANNNVNGYTYVAYIFAHNAGGFGETGTENSISCGTFTTNGSGIANINLGYEPQIVLVKAASTTSPWFMIDTTRGWNTRFNWELYPNTDGDDFFKSVSLNNVTNTGFNYYNASYPSTSFIYMTIRRGPMKAATSGETIFSPKTSAGGAGQKISTNVYTDLFIAKQRAIGGWEFFDRLRGVNSPNTTADNYGLESNNDNGETLITSGTGWIDNVSFLIPSFLGGVSSIYYTMKRAPKFFDAVLFTGTGTAQNITHNLGIAPQLMIVKKISTNGNWATYSSTTGPGNFLLFNDSGNSQPGTTYWNNTNPTASVFTVGTSTVTNAVGETFVAYLFGTSPGVSKVGTYTGTGSTQTIDCGFSGGARFVLIKRTDASGDWHVWDTARGMVSGADYYLQFNNTSAEVNSNDVYTTTTGFQLVSAATHINALSGTYIYLAIA